MLLDNILSALGYGDNGIAVLIELNRTDLLAIAVKASLSKSCLAHLAGSKCDLYLCAEILLGIELDGS